jgi:hypothetical protein
MPELPDLTLYRDALAQRVVGQRPGKMLILMLFLLRTGASSLARARNALVWCTATDD